MITEDKEMTYRTLKSMARNLEFEDESSAACYIMDSLLNGNRSQARNLYTGLYREQKTIAIDYIAELYPNADVLDLLRLSA